jgi:CHASE3 domain sensor protein
VALSGLQHLASDNPEQAARIDPLRKNVDTAPEFTRAIEFGPSHLAEALAILATARGQQLTPEIERNVADLRQVELVLLEQRQRIADASVTSTAISAAALSIFVVVGVAIGAFLLERQNAMGELHAAK